MSATVPTPAAGASTPPHGRSLAQAFAALSTPLLADACLRAKVPLRLGPLDLRPMIAGSRLAGRALPARHAGSVDVFLEALGAAEPGDVLVIDNRGRRDEGCIGDLTVLEMQAAGLAGAVVWGCHRDTDELLQIGFPVFSLGTCPAGPRDARERDADALERARLGDVDVRHGDALFADADGLLVIPGERLEEVLARAGEIRETERRQADAVRGGTTLRRQLAFDDYLARRREDASYTFRRHLRERGGEIEE